jgi:3-hydroxybutyryl-CoA dehydratase
MKKGDKFTRDFVISEKTYTGFCETFNDRNPLHVDKAFAQKRGFKDIVMHGNILNGFISFFVGECLPVKHVILQSQGIKYHNPFYLNDKIKFEAEIVDVFESVGMADFKFIFSKQDGLKVAKGMFQVGLIK